MSTETTTNTSSNEIDLDNEDGFTTDQWNNINTRLFRQRDEIRAEIDALRADNGEITAMGRRTLKRLTRRLDDVTGEIVSRNMGLAMSYARKFSSKLSHGQACDLESAAVLGLMAAIDTFDYTKGIFSSWAFKPIQRAVLRAVRSEEFPGLTVTEFELRPRVLAARNVLLERNGVVPSDADIAEDLDVPVTYVTRILHQAHIGSLNAVVHSEGTAVEVGDLIPANEHDFTERIAAAQFVDALTRYGLPVLEEREHFVIARRFGLDGDEPMNLHEVGEELGLSREAVRQVEAKALARLQHPIVLSKIVAAARD